MVSRSDQSQLDPSAAAPSVETPRGNGEVTSTPGPRARYGTTSELSYFDFHPSDSSLMLSDLASIATTVSLVDVYFMPSALFAYFRDRDEYDVFESSVKRAVERFFR